MTAWYTSDHHFWHDLVAIERGFSCDSQQCDCKGGAEAMNEAIIEQHNKLVKPDDLVWMLGDLGIDKHGSKVYGDNRILDCAARLNGRKQFITGNHDSVWPANRNARRNQRDWLDTFESVQPFARVKLAGRTILLSHFPYQGNGEGREGLAERGTQFRLPDLGEWLLHGHTHSTGRISATRSLHVGLDAWDLRPVSEVQVRDWIAGQEELLAA